MGASLPSTGHAYKHGPRVPPPPPPICAPTRDVQAMQITNYSPAKSSKVREYLCTNAPTPLVTWDCCPLLEHDDAGTIVRHDVMT